MRGSPRRNCRPSTRSSTPSRPNSWTSSRAPRWASRTRGSWTCCSRRRSRRIASATSSKRSSGPGARSGKAAERRVMKFVLALGQMDVTLGDPGANAARARALAAEAAGRGATLLLLPELWPTGYDLGRAPEYAAPTDAGPFALMAELARAHRLHVYGSCLADLGPG